MLVFHKFKPEDWEDFKAIAQEAFARENIMKKNFLNLLNDEGLIGAFVETKLVGYLRLLVLDKYGHLGQIAVEKSERGKGYGDRLMEYALNYFKQKRLSKVGLYVETNNLTAISLYEKYGFKKIHESWHYWIDSEKLEIIEDKKGTTEESELKVLETKDYDEIIRVFPEVNNKELKIHLSEVCNVGLSGGISLPLGLFIDNKLVVYGRFNPEFPGCRPFWITNMKFFDQFVKLMKRYKKRDHLRITFDKNKELAKFFAEREYKLHHHLYFMEKE